MKYFHIALFLMITSCSNISNNYTEYYLLQTTIIAKEDREAVDKCMSSVMQAASFHLTTSDYEDMDDAIETASEKCKSIYVKDITILVKYIHSDTLSVRVKTKLQISELLGHDLEVYNRMVSENLPVVREQMKL